MLTVKAKKARRSKGLKKLLRRVKRKAFVPSYRTRTVSEVIVVYRGEERLGRICLDDSDKVLSRDEAIPPYVALKVLLLATRAFQLNGSLVCRADGLTYSWDVIDEDELQEMGER